jgi:hypothetical protein
LSHVSGDVQHPATCSSPDRTDQSSTLNVEQGKETSVDVDFQAKDKSYHTMLAGSQFQTYTSTGTPCMG